MEETVDLGMSPLSCRVVDAGGGGLAGTVEHDEGPKDSGDDVPVANRTAAGAAMDAVGKRLRYPCAARTLLGERGGAGRDSDKSAFVAGEVCYRPRLAVDGRHE
ncbi:MAG TPA: hypothetical protein VFG53_02625 [Anaeromyxobacter sp.]|nr:hypothetical protein [Anaeromyxobacter sp.]